MMGRINSTVLRDCTVTVGTPFSAWRDRLHLYISSDNAMVGTVTVERRGVDGEFRVFKEWVFPELGHYEIWIDTNSTIRVVTDCINPIDVEVA